LSVDNIRNTFWRVESRAKAMLS